MTQYPQPPAERPSSRRDSTRPPRARRGSNDTPYPGAPDTAPGTTHPPAARTRTRRARANAAPSRARAASVIPATVWTCGADPIDPHTRWPVPIIETAIAAFTAPGARVALLPWPTHHAQPPAEKHGASKSDLPASERAQLAAARDAVEALGRTVEITDLTPAPDPAQGPSRPFWADPITDRPVPAPGIPQHLPDPAGAAPANPGETASAGTTRGADLIVTVLPTHQANDGSADQVAIAAAGLLSEGGILAVLTRSDWTRDRLADPTGAMVASGQNADLLYLQHIVTLHTPVRGGRLHPVAEAAIAEHNHTASRARTRSLPAPHLHAHGDVLVFSQPHAHQPTAAAITPAPAGARRHAGEDIG